MPATKASPIGNDTPCARVLLALAAIAAVAALLPGRAGAAAEPCEPAVGRIVSLQGLVEVQPAGTASWTPAALDAPLCIGDSIRAGAYSQAAVALANDSVASVDQLTTMRFVGESEGGRSWIDLLFGDVHFFSHRPRALEVDTPIANAFTEGTEFLVRARPERTEVILLDGRVRLVSPEGEVLLASGDAGVAVAGQAPRREIVARPRDAVAWALYYPPILAPLAAGEAAPALPPGLQRAVERVAANDYAGALGALDAMPEAARDARYYTYRAGVLLNVGRVDEAAAALERALALEPDAAEALAERAVIAVVQNREEAALADGRRAVELAPDSAPARIALSYAQQAAFDLDATRDVLREATTRTPDDPLVFARLAEIELSFGDLGAAQEAAERAVALAPGLARTQMVLGFAALTRIEIDQAKGAFQRAIELDSALPLARLGLGLARIREGDLEEGRRELEIAAALDPNDSLLRSYLGKAYFEERRRPLDAEQFQVAKQLDPNDPTPYFYDAIRLQTENRPVEALRELETSIALNDNRAIYRSRLLLDEDQAVRGSRLGRIYRDLGFEQRALVEGWRSVNRDPSNHSAHRLLADTYSVLPLHEIAQDSELLQAQLLQPLNVEPVQPRLAGSQLEPLGGAGAGGVSLNEYTGLFVANQASLLADGVVGSQSTLADELVVSGIYNAYSASLGQSHFGTDGFRPNNDLNENVYDVFGQTQISPTTSLLAEYRFRDADAGDLELRFWPDNFFRDLRQGAREEVFRVGGRHFFTPYSTMIGSYSFSRARFYLETPRVSNEREDDGHFVELRHIVELPILNATGGFGYFTGDEDAVTTFAGERTTARSKSEHRNAYFYSQIYLHSDVSLNLGVSYDDFEGSITDRSQLNPKVGLLWNLTPWTTLRAGAFRTLKRTFVSSQTIEPTQVAGFNQFFDDTTGTDAWRYGIGLDQKLTSKLFAGAELTQRDVAVPTEDDPDVGPKYGSEEKSARAYLYWTPSDRVAVALEYRFLDRDDEDLGEISGLKITTHTVPIQVRLFHPSGLFARVGATFVDQSGRFLNLLSGELEEGSDRFWVADAGIGYRFPNRVGLMVLEARNLFDKGFQFHDIDFDRSDPTTLPERSILPERAVFARLILRF